MTAFPHLVPKQQDIVEEKFARAAESRRLTLVARAAAVPSAPQGESTRVVTIDALGFLLRISIEGALPIDIERIILDRSASVKDFLEFIVSLPHEFGGDVLLMSEDGGAYMSSTGRGAGRYIHSLTADDVHFYLTTNGLSDDPSLRS